jgi:hypothetical protein
MSRLTRALMDNIDYEKVKSVRLTNFKFLHDALSSVNRLRINIDDIVCPMVYPFLTDDMTLRGRLIGERIYVARYWDGVCASVRCMSDGILPLPVDQRYNTGDMSRIAESIMASL